MAGTIAIIPARLASTRFPEKVLAAETGQPLIQHAVERARAAGSVDRVVVACDDQRIVDALAPFETEAVLTAVDHPNGTCRLAEAAALLGLDADAIIVNVQGDEPEIDPAVIDAAVEALVVSGAPMSTAASPFAPDDDPADPNIVKVVTRPGDDGIDRALYFSRALIPHTRDATRDPAAVPLKHVGLYVYRRNFLDSYAKLPESPLEKTEKLEQLRALEHGVSIAVAIRPCDHHGIDTPEQYRAFVQRWRAVHS